MLPAAPLPCDLRHIRMESHESFGHPQPPVVFVQLIRVTAFHQHRRHLLSQERREENRTPTILQRTQREVRVFIVAATPSIRKISLDENTGVDSAVEVERWHLTLSWREHVVVHSR